LWIDDERAVESSVQLADLVRMGVVPARAGRVCGERVHEPPTRRDGRLGNARYTVHRERHVHTMPVDRRGLRQAVLHDDPDAFTCPDAEDRPRNLSVVGPGHDAPAGCEFPPDRARHKTCLLYTSDAADE